MDTQQLPHNTATNCKAGLPWHGRIRWSWWKGPNTHGTFEGALVSAGNYPAGCEASNALQAVHGQLHFTAMLPHTASVASEAAKAWTGDVMLLKTSAEGASNNGNEHVRPSAEGQEDLLGKLQHSRLAGCLQGSRAALFATVFLTPVQPQHLELSPSTPQLKHAPEQVNLVSSPADTASTASNDLPAARSGLPPIPPAINILLVALEHLHLWLPESALDQQQRAEVASQGHMHSTSICALPIVCHSSEPITTLPHQQQQRQQQQQMEFVPEQHSELSDEYMQDLSDNMHQPAMLVEDMYDIQHAQQAKRAVHADAEASLSPNKRPRVEADSEAVNEPQQLPQQQLQHPAISHQHHDQQQPQQEQPQQQHASWQPQAAKPIEHEVVDSILRSIKQLGLLYSDKHGMQELTQQQLAQLQTQPLLTQLRMLSVHATSYNPERSAADLFQERYISLQQSDKSTLWLNTRYGSPSNRRLSHEAEGLLTQLIARRVLRPKAVPGLAAQVLPADLQPAYVLCLGGYSGARALPDFAAHALHAVAVKVYQALQQCPNAHAQQHAAREGLQLAYKLRQQAGQANMQPEHAKPNHAKPDGTTALASSPPHQSAETSSAPLLPKQRSHVQVTKDPRRKGPADGRQLSMQNISAMVRVALIKLDRITASSLDSGCLRALQFESPLDQLLVWSKFCGQVDRDRSHKASAFLHSLVQVQRRQTRKQMRKQLSEVKQKPKGQAHLVGFKCQQLLDAARQAGVLTGTDAQASARSAIAELPSQLDRVAACCAVYFFMQHPDEEALRQLKAAVTAMQELLQEARLALA